MAFVAGVEAKAAFHGVDEGTLIGEPFLPY
jgi:hypothetical protein